MVTINVYDKSQVDNIISGINEVPDSTSSDADKVLTVNSSGTAVWGRKITISSSAPSGGSDGDIWLQYS